MDATKIFFNRNRDKLVSDSVNLLGLGNIFVLFSDVRRKKDEGIFYFNFSDSIDDFSS